MEVYITNSNSEKIVYGINLQNIDIEREIFLINLRWFNDYEIKQIVAFKLLYENPKEFFKNYKKNKPIDTKNYVYEGNLPAYHSKVDCSMLGSNFKNYSIPNEIKNRGEESIKEFREWFKLNAHILDEKNYRMDLFLDKIRWHFNLKERPEVKIVDYANSGVDMKENLNLQELANKINSLLRDIEAFLNSSEETKIILLMYGKNSYYNLNKKFIPSIRGISGETIRETLTKFETLYKKPLRKYLAEYYKVYYNPELKFEGALLEQIGFKPCRLCSD